MTNLKKLPSLLSGVIFLGLVSTSAGVSLFTTSVPGTGPFGDGELGYTFGGATAATAPDPDGGGGTVSAVTVPQAAAAFGEGLRFSFGSDNANSEPLPSSILGALFSFSYEIYLPTPDAGSAYDGGLVLARWYDSVGTTNKGEQAPTYDGSGVGTGFNSVAGFALQDPSLFDTWQTVTMNGYMAPSTATNASGGPPVHLEFNIFTNAADANTGDISLFLRNVTLDFEPVPEPSSLLLTALASLGLLRRRR